MTVGYVRLSRDDDGHNYVSIDNQKLILTQYAQANNLTIERWYEDDGFSGYIFNRPAFSRMLEDINKDVTTILVKDFSRLGRHNARVLLFLDDIKKTGCRLIAVDDDYDSSTSDDDLIGIKTWYNERYIKDTSKKIRRALNARQKAGTLIINAPYGYKCDPHDKQKFNIVDSEAKCIREIFDMYISGMGYRRIALSLNDKKILTPSAARGRKLPDNTGIMWTDSMVRSIISNDIYTGVLRLHKRSRIVIHGADRRVPQSQQYIFPSHHPAIISHDIYTRVCQIRASRNNSSFRGKSSTTPSDAFAGLLYCSSCNHLLTPITRYSSNRIPHRYYICSLYNSKGKKYCSCSHLVHYEDLTAAVLFYLNLCIKLASDEPVSPDICESHRIKASIINYEEKLTALINSRSAQLIKSDTSSIVIECYDRLINETADTLNNLKYKLAQQQSASTPVVSEKKHLQNIIEKESFTSYDLAMLFDKICVYPSGCLDIELHYDSSCLH